MKILKTEKILVIFKTHLDIGFTDLAAEVTDRYMNVFIPSAMKTAEELRSGRTDARMKWTTGSWLVWKYLEACRGTEKEEAAVRAIENGDICWHALPCTTHTELMDRELFGYGLSLSRRLDKRFGKTTRAAKMTDVPGHTKAMIPLLRKAGVDFIHIGVNEASAVPDVPGIFRWQCDSGETLNVMYEGSYGDYREIGDTGVAVVFAHTNDNKGCQSAAQVEKIFRRLHKQYPDAEITAATLDDVADVVRSIEDTLPLVTDEIGDSWIHGAGTDPLKTRTFRALEEVMEALPEGEDREKLSAGLLMIPEHTWGCDEKTWLRDYKNYKRKDFEKHINKPNYRKMIASWEEQRAFMSDAVASLSPGAKKAAEAALEKIKLQPVSLAGKKKIACGEKIKCGGFTFAFDESGRCIYLERGGRIIADENHPLFGISYELFTFDDYLRFHRQYNRIEDDWAWRDFTKEGMHRAITRHSVTLPQAEIYAGEKGITVVAEYSGRVYDLYGAPGKFTVEYTPDGKKINVRLQWTDKHATRVAEAIWLSFSPAASEKRISKLGTLIDPCKVVSRGGRGLCATDRGVFWKNLSVETRDAVLVAPGRPSLLDFNDKLPSDEEGINFNLYNNVWGTNFPMWCSDDALFRFTVDTEETK